MTDADYLLDMARELRRGGAIAVSADRLEQIAKGISEVQRELEQAKGLRLACAKSSIPDIAAFGFKDSEDGEWLVDYLDGIIRAHPVLIIRELARLAQRRTAYAGRLARFVAVEGFNHCSDGSAWCDACGADREGGRTEHEAGCIVGEAEAFLAKELPAKNHSPTGEGQ